MTNTSVGFVDSFSIAPDRKAVITVIPVSGNVRELEISDGNDPHSKNS